jgi:hypothetical protein
VANGKWFQFGQAPNLTLPWPAFDVTSFTASINYETRTARVQMARKQVVEPGRVRPAPVEQRPGADRKRHARVESGGPQPVPDAVEERLMAEIWTTPHGFVRAALANNATSQPADGGSDVSFTMDGSNATSAASTPPARSSASRPSSTTP